MEHVSSMPALLSPFAQSGPLGLATLAVLVLLSLASWTVFLARARTLRAARKSDEAFLATFEAHPRLEDLTPRVDPSGPPVLALFHAGRNEMIRVAPPHSLEPRVEAALAMETERQRARAASGLALLASVANLSPFVGLFGTVVGIVSAFARIAAASEASLAVVAAPISEALLATAVGLGVALPAAAGHAFLARQVAALDTRLETFRHMFANAVRRTEGRASRPVGRDSRAHRAELELEALP